MMEADMENMAMSNNLDPTNRSALRFNIEFSEKRQQICEHITDKDIGIIDVFYYRIFNDGTKLYVADTKWVEHYLINNFQDNVEHIAFYAPGKKIKHGLWSGFKTDPIFSTASDIFDWGNGFTMYEYSENYVDVFDFHAHKNNFGIVNYYINNLDVLNKKVHFFKEKIFSLIDFTDKSKLMVSQNWRPFEEVPQNPLLSVEKEQGFLDQITLK